MITKTWKAVLLTLLLFGVPGLILLGMEAWRDWYANYLVELERCLPEGIRLSTEFSESPQTINPRGDRRAVVTVKDKLIQIGAYCKDGVIYDKSGKRVFFLHVPEFRIVNYPPDWGERLKKYEEELEKLKAEGTVIKMFGTIRPH